jgi:prophage tail gpP-like protein/phage tail protein X
MSRSYVVQPGDTFDLIARKQYGDDQQAPAIRQANPGASNPLVAGTSLVIPARKDAQASASGNAQASSPNEVSISIKGERFRFWTTVTITRTLDAVTTVQFDAPFTPDDASFRDKFRPFSFNDVNIDIGGSRLFTGTMVVPSPTLMPTARTVSVACYAKPGVLGDCTAPASAFPLQWDEVTLAVIAEKCAAFFGLGVQFDADPGATFLRIMAAPSERMLPFLAGLTSQRGLVISDTPDGKVLFRKAIETGTPVANLTGGVSPLTGVAPQFSAQDYYSHVTGIGPTIIGLTGLQFTVKNTRLGDVVRPYTFESPDTPDASVQQSVETKAGRMFANAVTYEVHVATWRDESGGLWEPNTLVTLLAEGAMVYTRSTFLIRSVTLSKTPQSETAVLTLILPGALAGKIPETMPWD